MSTEQAMNAYVLLGNALHYVANRAPADPESRFSAPAIRDLYSKLETLPPARILDAVAELTPDERNLLASLCRYIILGTASKETETILGLPSEAVDQTLTELGL